MSISKESKKTTICKLVFKSKATCDPNDSNVFVRPCTSTGNHSRQSVCLLESYATEEMRRRTVNLNIGLTQCFQYYEMEKSQYQFGESTATRIITKSKSLKGLVSRFQ